MMQSGDNDAHPLAINRNSSASSAAYSIVESIQRTFTRSSAPPVPAVATSNFSVTYSDDDNDPPANPYSHMSVSGQPSSSLPSSSSSSSSSSMLRRLDYTARTDAFHRAIDARHSGGIIDEGIVRAYIFDYGAPERPNSSRALVWKLLIGYLPWDRSKWKSTMNDHRRKYEDMIREQTSNPFEQSESSTPKSSSASADATASSASAASSSGPKVSSSSKTTLSFQRVSACDDPLSRSSPLAPSGNAPIKPTRAPMNASSNPLSSSSSSSRPSSLSLSSPSPPSSSSSAPSTAWERYYADNLIRDEIEKDVRRTYSSFHFFHERVRPQTTTSEEVKKANEEQKAAAAALAKQGQRGHRHGGSTGSSGSGGGLENLFDDAHLRHTATMQQSGTGSAVARAPRPKVNDESFHSPATGRGSPDENHHDVLKRILFLYAKLHPDIRYVQGMNEILAPIYYLFARHATIDLKRFAPDGEPILDANAIENISGMFQCVGAAEPDAFFVFSAAMSHVRSRFVKSQDKCAEGVLSSIASLNRLLKSVDLDLWAHLDNIGVDPRFYSFRWLTLLLSQEFELPDVLRLWDSLLAAEAEIADEPAPATVDKPAPVKRGEEKDDIRTMENEKGARKGTLSLSSSSSFSSSPSPSPTSPPSSPSPPPFTPAPRLIVSFLADCCCAMLTLLRLPLIASEFGHALQALQAAGQGLDVQRVIFTATDIRKKRWGDRKRRATVTSMMGTMTKISAGGATLNPSPLNEQQVATDFATAVPVPDDARQEVQQIASSTVIDAAIAVWTIPREEISIPMNQTYKDGVEADAAAMPVDDAVVTVSLE